MKKDTESRQAIIRHEKKKKNRITLANDLITIVSKIKKENYRNDKYIYLDYVLLKKTYNLCINEVIKIINETQAIIVENLESLYEEESRDLESYSIEQLASRIKIDIEYYKDTKPIYREIAKLYVNIYINLDKLVHNITTQAGIVREEEIVLNNSIAKEIENIENILYENEIFFYMKMRYFL